MSGWIEESVYSSEWIIHNKAEIIEAIGQIIMYFKTNAKKKKEKSNRCLECQ